MDPESLAVHCATGVQGGLADAGLLLSMTWLAVKISVDEAGLAARLSWLAAAADASQCRVAWLALDPGDADLRQFLTHLVAAIQTAEPEVVCRRARTVGWRSHANRGCVGQPSDRSRAPRSSVGAL